MATLCPVCGQHDADRCHDCGEWNEDGHAERGGRCHHCAELHAAPEAAAREIAAWARELAVERLEGTTGTKRQLAAFAFGIVNGLADRIERMEWRES